MSDFGTHPDGRPVALGDMTKEQRREVWREAAARVVKKLDTPEMRANLARVLSDGPKSV